MQKKRKKITEFYHPEKIVYCYIYFCHLKCLLNVFLYFMEPGAVRVILPCAFLLACFCVENFKDTILMILYVRII